MIGPGTGIAPMRALLQERELQRQQVIDKSFGKNILYFGCKSRALDFIYKDELEDFQQKGVLDDLQLAFSREQSKKVK
jgi:NADPH-ferrihemoprotein reductase